MTGYRERPREALTYAPPRPDDGSARVHALAGERQRRERLERARDAALSDVRHRPEDSSPAIRRLLGYTDTPRPPRRWEHRAGIRRDGSYGLVCVEAREVGSGPGPTSARFR